MNGARKASQAWLQALACCDDAAGMRSAVSGLCAEFGKVTSMDILTMAESRKRQALCFLRLESEAQETQLMSSLGGLRFGSDVLVIVDLPAGPDAIAPWRSAQAAQDARQ